MSKPKSPEFDLQQFKQDGFLVLKDLISPEIPEAIQHAALEVFVRQLKAQGFSGIDNHISEPNMESLIFQFFSERFQTFLNCGKQIQHLVPLHQLSLSESILNIVTAAGVKTPVISTRPVLYFNHPRLAKDELYWRVFAHQDWASMQGSLNSVVVWIPLRDIDVCDGALQIVPGSHKRGLQAKEFELGFGRVENYTDAEFVSLPCRLGDVVIFNSFLVHRSGTNVTDRIRWSCHFRYNDLDDPSFIERGFPHPYIYKPIESFLTPGFPRPGEVEQLFST